MWCKCYQNPTNGIEQNLTYLWMTGITDMLKTENPCHHEKMCCNDAKCYNILQNVITFCVKCRMIYKFEPPHDKTNKMTMRPAKTQISLGIRPVWSESSLSARRKLGSLAIHWAHSEDFDQTGWMSRLFWVFAGRMVILLVLSWGGSFDINAKWCNFWKIYFTLPILRRYNILRGDIPHLNFVCGCLKILLVYWIRFE